MRTSQGFIVIAIALLLQSCFDSSDYIFDEAEATDITIDASLAHSMSTVSPSVKADTFSINDTIYFLTNITPNKIIRVQDYHWLMDVTVLRNTTSRNKLPNPVITSSSSSSRIILATCTTTR